MRKYVYLLAACAIFVASAFSATAGPGCETHEKKCIKDIEAIALSVDELEDGKVIEVGDHGELVMTRDGDAWTFTLTDKEGNENSVFTIALDDEAGDHQTVKVVTTTEGDNVWTSVTTGEEHHIGGHKAIFISDGSHPDGHHDGKHCTIHTSGDKDVICKQFETIHCGPAYTCGECGLTVSVPKDKDKGAYACPNGCGDLSKCDRTKEMKKCYSYKVVTGTDTDVDIDVDTDMDTDVEK